MTPEQLTHALALLNEIDRAIGDGKPAAYKAVDDMRDFLPTCADNMGISGSAADVWAMTQLSSVMGTADPRNVSPGEGRFNTDVVVHDIAAAERRVLTHEDSPEDGENE